MSNLIEWGGDGWEFCIIFQIVTLEIRVTDQRGEYEDYRRVPQIENAQTIDTKLPLLSLPPSPLSLPFPLSLAFILPFFLLSLLSSFLPSLFLLCSPYFHEIEFLQKAVNAGVSGLDFRKKGHHGSMMRTYRPMHSGRNNGGPCLHERTGSSDSQGFVLSRGLWVEP